MDQISESNESGFIVLLGMLVLVLGAGAWFSSLGRVHSNTLAIQQDQKHVAQLHRIKDKMLSFAALHPDIYKDATNIPGPGYFPCPDEDGDGDSDATCGIESTGTNELFVLGRVPKKISSRFFSFVDSDVDSGLYWFAVDSRFVNSSARFATAVSQRYSTINVDLLPVVTDELGSTVAPLTLDGKEDIVMILFYAGQGVSGQNRPSISEADYLEQGTIVPGLTHDFVSVGASSTVFNDYVITITRSEWEAAVLARVSQDIAPEDTVPDLCMTVAESDIHWFNDCVYTGANIPPFTTGTFPATCTYSGVIAKENITGQGWRSIICP